MDKKRWNRGDLLPQLHSPAYKKLLQELEEHVKFVESQRARLSPNMSVDDFMRILKTKEKMSEITARLGDYAYLWYSENTADQHAKSFMSTIEQLSVNVGNRIMFFSLWFKDMDEKNAKRIIAGVPKDYQYLLEFLRMTKQFTLTEPEEKIINMKDSTGASAVIKLYDMLTTDFTFTLDVDGKKRELTREQLTSYVKDPRAAVRKAAYQEMYRVYGLKSDVLNELYRNLILDWKNENVLLRKYKTPISARNLGNDVNDHVITTLLRVCQKNRGVFQEYFKLKAKFCKIKKMTRYDVYAPYHEKKKKYSYEAAQALVFKAYEAYSKEMATLARKVIADKHVDHEIRKNKMGGAYCLEVGPGITPYVLLNYDEDIRDVFTIAHELGHAVHDQLTHKHSILTSHPPLILAETASIFGEMLLFDDMMRGTDDKELKKTMIIQQLDNIYASVMRQAYFVLFEIRAHEMIKEGANLDKLTNAYLENLREQFGNALSIPDEFKYEWVSIPHIYHTPFYCYAYAFGNLLVLALYEQYRNEGKAFVPKYLKILAYGGAENPAKILKEVGIDISDEKFWQSGFDLVNEMIQELKKLS